MQKNLFVKIMALVSLLLSLNSLKGIAQFEINGTVNTSKQQSNYSNYKTGYKPPGWYTEGMKWARTISDMFKGFWSPGLKTNSIDPAAFMQDNTISSTEFLENKQNDFSNGFEESFNFNPAEPGNQSFDYGLGLGIGTKGGKTKLDDGSEKYNIWYIQLPVIMFRYNYMLKSGGKLFAAAGPYYAVAIAGTYKSNDVKEKLKFGNEGDNDFRRGDWGLKLRIGYRLKTTPILLGAMSDVGLRNISPGGNKSSRIRNQTFGLQIGYEF